MGYSELIKHFDRIRNYMHEFYIYGFKDRNQITHKSKRSYDNEKRRLESYLKDFMSFQYTTSKTVFLSIDSRQMTYNPLYKAFEAKSFTHKDITLHFYILDILYDDSQSLTFQEILNKVDEYLALFPQTMHFDESTLRKKLKEYVNLGILTTTHLGKQVYYQRTKPTDLSSYQYALSYYSEIFPLGVIGHYMLNQLQSPQYFSFKHHYISRAIDSEIMAKIFDAMKQKKSIYLIHHHNQSYYIVPLRLYISSQNGRCHLLAYSYRYKQIKTFRIDHIKDIKLSEDCDCFDDYRTRLKQIEKHIWSVQCHEKQPLEHVSMTIQILPHEQYVLQRLQREKRHGTITQINDTSYEFSIDIYDTYEILPWIRTFIGRILKLNFSNRTIENQFKEDIKKMYELYQIKGSDES